MLQNRIVNTFWMNTGLDEHRGWMNTDIFFFKICQKQLFDKNFSRNDILDIGTHNISILLNSIFL